MTTKKIWGEVEKQVWFEKQTIKRSYRDLVMKVLEGKHEAFDKVCYGRLSIDPERYPLYYFKSRPWSDENPSVLITGGVHGYETSGVLGAIDFLQGSAAAFLDRFNFLIFPCVSPWGFETINRWNPKAVDPNRSFNSSGLCQESDELRLALGKVFEHRDQDLLAHFDLHETTDTDNTVFRPALAARDGVELVDWGIPDGFYLVGDSEKTVPDFQGAVIGAVENVTHIAPPDERGLIIGEKVHQRGVIYYPAQELGLCMGLTSSPFVTTTEVYPDSERVTDSDCNQAQVASIIGGLTYLRDYHLGT